MSKKQIRDDSYVKRQFRIGAILVAIICGAVISIGWSFNETLKVGVLMTGSKPFALALALVIQYTPNAILAFWFEQTEKTIKIIMLSVVLGLNFINIGTSLLAFNQRWDSTDRIKQAIEYGYSGDIVAIIYFFGVLGCFIIPWYEEVAFKGLSRVFHLWGVNRKQIGKKSPNWLFEAERIAQNAGSINR